MITRQSPIGDAVLVTLPNGKKDLGFVSGGEAVVNRLAVKFRFWLGEWFPNRDEGFPWREQVFKKGFTKEQLAALFRRAILTEREIERVDSLDVETDAATREVAISWTATLRDGAVISADPSVDSRFVLGLPDPTAPANLSP